VKRLATATFVLFAALGPTCFAQCIADVESAKDGEGPILSFHSAPTDPAYGSVDLQRLGAEAMSRLRRNDPSQGQWQKVFAVRVDDTRGSASDALPPVVGRYELLPDGLRFAPLYPPIAGQRYRASADLSALSNDLDQVASCVPLTFTFSLPQEAVVTSTVIDKIFPSGDALPENLLRFYVYFSAPMQKGEAQQHIVLLGPDGQPVAAAFLGLTTELWDPAMRRLTLLLDPGRIKRGVGPNIALGAPLHQGDQYTLVIDNGIHDALGHPLREPFSKPFRVTAAIRTAVDPRGWTFDLPASGTRQPLFLHFPNSLDQALLLRKIRIADADRNPVAGMIDLDRQETLWIFTPSSAWAAGQYEIRIDAALEDVSGNNLNAAFDVDVRGNSDADVGLQTSVPFLIGHEGEKARMAGRSRILWSEITPGGPF
jgi:hypothetical protein